MVNFGSYLKELRNSKNLTQEQFSKVIRISLRSIQRYETNERKPTVDILISFCDFFNVSADSFLGTNQNKKHQITNQQNSKIAKLDKGKYKLIENYDMLNDEGQNKLVEYSDDLIVSNKYKKTNSEINFA